MKLKLITVGFDAESGSFPTEPLAQIEGEIVSVVEHFFQHNGMPHLLLIVHYRPSSERRTAPPRVHPSAGIPAAPAATLRAELSEDERELFDRLRAWRNGRAQAEGVPPYVLLHNRQLAQLARRRPSTLAALREIDGIGEAKAGRFGAEVLAVLTQPRAAREAAHAA